jgi:hypothetical protein
MKSLRSLDAEQVFQNIIHDKSKLAKLDEVQTRHSGRFVGYLGMSVFLREVIVCKHAHIPVVGLDVARAA